MNSRQIQSKFANLKKSLKQQILLIVLLISLFATYEKSNACGSGGGNYHIVSSVTWTATSIPIGFVGQNIIVDPNVTFTISGATLSFQTGCGIYINPGGTLPAKLIVRNGAVLQGCSGAVWRGIFCQGIENVVGAYYTSYTYNSGTNTVTGPASNQCSVVIDHSIIQGADTGVKIINEAILQISNDTFLNNYIGIGIEEFVPDYYYSVILNMLTYVHSASYIRNTLVNVQSLISGHSGLINYECVDLGGTQYIELMGNTFECTYPVPSSGDERPYGIFGRDGNFSLHDPGATQDMSTGCLDDSATLIPNQFKWLGCGIYTESTSAPINYYTYTIHVRGCEFHECNQAMDIIGGYLNVIENNPLISFNPLLSSARTYWDSATVYPYQNLLVNIESSEDFIFYGNYLTENMPSSIFLDINSSGPDTSQISKDTFINTVATASLDSPYEYAIRIDGLVNSGLIITCNHFVNHIYGIYNESLTLCDLGDPDDGVENTFSGISRGFDLFNYNNGTYNYFTFNPPAASITSGAGPSMFPLIPEDATSGNCHEIESCQKWPWQVTGIKRPFHQLPDLKVYPNPTSDQIIFDLSLASENILGAKLSIMDITGRSMGNYKFNEMGSRLVINTSGYAAGIYIYHLTMNGNTEKSGKFEVSH